MNNKRPYKISNNHKHIYQLRTSKYQAYKRCKWYKHARYKLKWEREISNHKHGRIISRFEPLALHSRLHRNEGFSLKLIPQNHSMPQHLQVLSRILGPSSPSFVPTRTIHTRTHKFVEATISNFLNYKGRTLGDQLFDHKKNLSQTRIL